jgi:exonuclease III
VRAVECPNAPDTPQDRRTDKSKLSVASFNAYFLFNETTGGISPWKDNHTLAAAHLERVASVVRQLNPDVLNFVEVDNCDTLRNVIALVGEEYGYKPYLIKGKDTYTRQNVGLLTRVDPKEDLTRTDDRVDYPVPGGFCGYSYTKDTSLSKHYVTYMEVPYSEPSEEEKYIPMVLLGAHFKAIPTDPASCAQREAQAMVGAKLLNTTFLQHGGAAGTTQAIFLGDLNDYTDSLVDVYGNRPISRAVHIIRNFLKPDPYAHFGEKTIETDDMYNVAHRVSVEERYSNWYDRNDNNIDDGKSERSLIDHVLVTKGLENRIEEVVIDHSFDSDLLYSDHWPVMVTFDTKSPQLPATPSVQVNAGNPVQINSMKPGTSTAFTIAHASTSLCEAEVTLKGANDASNYLLRFRRGQRPTFRMYDAESRNGRMPISLCETKKSLILNDDDVKIDQNDTLYIEITKLVGATTEDIQVSVDAIVDEDDVPVCDECKSSDDCSQTAYGVVGLIIGAFFGVLVTAVAATMLGRKDRLPLFCSPRRHSLLAKGKETTADPDE